jgi:Asp/Glu/hydantoin racemase
MCARVLWQGFVDPQVHHAYVDRLVDYLDEVAEPGSSFEFRGLRPPDRHLHRLTEARGAVQAVEGIVRAERDGFDAVILGHFQDSGLWEARSAVDVPVVGLGETSMLHACTLGFRLALVTISPAFVRWHEEQVLRYRLEERVVGVGAMETDVDLYMRAFANRDAYQEVRAQFVERARPLVEAGAEVLIPAGGLPALLFREERDFAVEGAMVLNPTLVAAKHAEMAVRLRELGGIGASRRATFARPSPEALSEFVDQIGTHVAERPAAARAH